MAQKTTAKIWSICSMKAKQFMLSVVGKRCVYLNNHRICGAKPYVSENIPQINYIVEAQQLLNAIPEFDNSDLVEALQKAVRDYGKPGGPWNVPSEPGTWIEMANTALKKREKIKERN
jgi:hypothetical protein